MEIEKDEEKKNNLDDVNDDELLQKFSKHKKSNNNNNKNSNVINSKKTNKNDIFIKCSFDDKTIEENKILLSKYEESGIIKTAHYFSLDKDELEDPIDPKKIKRENNNFYLFEKDVENSDLYCGYIDHMDLQKVKNKNKSIISCPFCFSLISNNIIENKTELGYIIIGKSKSIFKDFSSNILNSEEAKNLFKDNKGIKNYEKKLKIINNNENNEINYEEQKEDKDNLKDIQGKMDIENNIDDKEEDKIEHKYVIISCVNCGNIIGLCDAFDNTKIILEYL